MINSNDTKCCHNKKFRTKTTLATTNEDIMAPGNYTNVLINKEVTVY